MSSLSALDYFEIEQLVAKYARAIDTCSNNGYDYADLFTADGFFAPDQNGVVGNRMQGRERLAEAQAAARAGARTSAGLSRASTSLCESHHHAHGRRRHGHGRHADDRPRRRPQQDPARGVLRGHVREDAAGLAVQVTHPSRPCGQSDAGATPPGQSK